MRLELLKILLVFVLAGLIPAASAQPIIVDGNDIDWETLDPLLLPLKYDIDDYTWDLSFKPDGPTIEINYNSGFDLEKGSIFVDILDYPNVSLYFKILTNGTVGDATGDGDPRGGIYDIDGIHIVREDSTVYDMGSREQYEIRFDYDGDNLAEERIIIGDEDQVYWDSDNTDTGLSAVWNGRVLEVGAENVGAHDSALSALTFRYDMYAGSGEDFWSEDRLPTLPANATPADFTFEPSCQGRADFQSISDEDSPPAVWYVWDFGDGSIQEGVDFAPSHQYAAGGTYPVTLEITNLWGLKDERTLDVTVGYGPISVNAGPDKSITIGNCTTIGGSPTAEGGEPPYTYAWTGDGLTDDDVPNPEVCPTTTTTYRVEVMDSNDYGDKETCYGADEVTVTVTGKPAISLSKSCPPSATVDDVITYEYIVENTGVTDLTDVVLQDDKVTPTYISGDDGDGLLNPGESWLYNATYTITVPTTNIATVTAVDMVTGTAVSANDRCTTNIPSSSTMGLIAMACLIGIIMAFGITKKE